MRSGSWSSTSVATFWKIGQTADALRRSSMGKRHRSKFLRGPHINPTAVSGTETAADLIDNAFLAYNGGRLREAARLFADRMLDESVTVGMSLTGAMTPAGLGMSCLIPLMEAGFVDWIGSTGANLYHDAHFALGLALH